MTITFNRESKTYFDENGNSCSVAHFGSHKRAIAALDSLDSCTGCTDCAGCTDCMRCMRSTDSTGCMRCTDCADGMGCTDCTRCMRCTDCTGSTDSTDCTGCTGCTDCTGCARCMGCTRCTDCTDFTDCTGCTGCKAYVVHGVLGGYGWWVDPVGEQAGVGCQQFGVAEWRQMDRKMVEGLAHDAGALHDTYWDVWMLLLDKICGKGEA